ncbi:hypothetical protein ACU5DF_21260 [Aliivibrio wodanis]|uniref:hypothetical protein n=1 Tax=Aliivibrio wodanis TaxID=80852 RepID=UPI00406C69FC
MRIILKVGIVIASFTIFTGCANDAPLGKSVYQLKDEQTYNKKATEENRDYIPTGSMIKNKKVK